MSEQMKPCPFCGGTDLQVAHTRPYWVVCSCGARAQSVKTKTAAIAAWNQRAGEAEKEESLWGKMVREVGEATSLQTENARLRAELAPLRALREAVTTIYDDLTHYGRDDLAAGDAGEGGGGDGVSDKPAVVYPPGYYILKEMAERGMSYDCLRRVGAWAPPFIKGLITREWNLMDDEQLLELVAFFPGTSANDWARIDRAWQDHIADVRKMMEGER